MAQDERPADLVASLDAVTQHVEQTMKTVAYNELTRVSDLIQTIHFEENLTPDQRKVLRRVLDYCIERKKIFA